ARRRHPARTPAAPRPDPSSPAPTPGRPTPPVPHTHRRCRHRCKNSCAISSRVRPHDPLDQFSRSSSGECQRSDLIEPYRQYVRLVTGLNETTAYLCTRVRDLPTTHFQRLEWAIVSGVPARITGDDTETHPWPLSEREKVGCLLAHDFAITYHALQHLLVYQHP